MAIHFRVDDLVRRKLSAAVASCLLIFSGPAFGSDVSGRALVDLQASLADARLDLASSSLRAVASTLGQKEKWSASDGHRAVRAIMEGVDVGRSVLVIDRSGRLKFDSYNKFRLFTPDLSEREYFVEGWRGKIGSAQIHNAVVGKQSGLEFVPMTMKTIGGDQGNGLLAVMTIVPKKLIPNIQICSVCGFVVLRDGEVIASSHSLSTANHDIAARLSFEGEYGQRALPVRGMNLSIHWRRSSKYGLVFVYYAAEEGGANE